MRYLIEHETVLHYPATVREHHIELRLVPRTDEHQKVLSCAIETEPAADLANYQDYFGNRVDYFCAIAPHDRLLTRLKAEVETVRENPFDFAPISPQSQWEWLSARAKQDPRLNDFVLHRSRLVLSPAKLAEELSTLPPGFNAGIPFLENLLALMGWIPTVMEYRTGATGVHADLADALKQKGGVCQDFAHLFIAVVRSWGIPARYVMGYLDPGICINGEELATHAWAEALVPGAGWVGFDATHNLLTNDRYIAVASGRDSYDAAPQRGSFKGDSPGEQPTVKVKVQEQ